MKLLLWFIIATGSIALFLYGFFPVASTTKNAPIHFEIKPTVQKAVIIVIDALRTDFVTMDNMPYLSKSYGHLGCFSHIKVETPTVTLPRIKALTTGSIPQFIDIIWNLANPTVLEDSLIHSAHGEKKNIVFYGDDTWLKLFPNLFKRYEGTSSFYVNDFTEVDDNVTRNVRNELKKNDWDLMVLHYLGLDHIGHVLGPKSPLILNKLKEMDDIIREIHETLLGRDEVSMVIITGDHGMRDSGGHGGATHHETNVPLVIMGVSCMNDSFSQVDIPTNLAVLLGLKIPSTSIGQLRSNILSDLPLSEYLIALKYNTLLLKDKLDACGDNFEKAEGFHEEFENRDDLKYGNIAVNLYQYCSKVISEKLLESSVKQKLICLVGSTLVSVNVLLNVVLLLYRRTSFQDDVLQFVFMTGFLAICFLDLFHEYLIFLPLLLFVLMCKNFMDLCGFVNWDKVDQDGLFFRFVAILHPITFLSSSFLEEEHQYWYFFGGSIIMVKMWNLQSMWWFLMLVGLRFLRTINQVGDKWASEPDLADWLLKKENVIYLQTFSILGLILVCYGCSIIVVKHKKLNITIDFVLLLLIYVFRFIANENILLGKFLWLCIFIKAVSSVLTGSCLLETWILLISLLMKPYNVIIIAACIFASRLLHKTVHKLDVLIMTHWWLGNLLFFAQGHDNSLASVDISSGYVGLSEYHPVYVFPQVLCHTYALPVLSHLLLFQNHKVDKWRSLTMFFMLRLYIIIVTFIVTFIFRYHLFIYSVFAPKVFVETSHFIFLFIEVFCFYVGYKMKPMEYLLHFIKG